MTRKTLLFFLTLLTGAVLLFSAGNAETATFKYLKADTDAEYLDLGANVVSASEMDQFYRFLDRFPNLKKVDLFSTRMGRKRVEALTARYPDIEFGMTMVYGLHEVRTDATAFSTLHGGACDTDHTVEQLYFLRYCPDLLALDLGHNTIPDLSFLYDMPQLRVLILAKDSCKDITPIAALKDLEYLEIFRNNVADISPLAGLDHLVDLNITTNRIPDLSPP